MNSINDDTPAFTSMVTINKCNICKNSGFVACEGCRNYSKFENPYARKKIERKHIRSNEEVTSDLKKIIEHHTSQNQHIKAIEECGELIVAIAKCDVKNIIEECVDAIIMIDQLLLIYNVDQKDFMEKYNAKIDRTLERMSSEGRKG